MGSDSGSDIDFLPYSSSDSNIELDKDQFLSTPNKHKKKSQQIQPSKQFKMFSRNGPCISSAHEGKMQPFFEKCNAKFVKKIELEKHFQSVHEGKKQHNCYKCNAIFVKKINFDYHFTSVHGGRHIYETCSTCFLNHILCLYTCSKCLLLQITLH